MTYKIQVPKPKKHWNSPTLWKEVKIIEAENAQSAAIRAMLLLGTARIRVLEQKEWKFL